MISLPRARPGHRPLQLRHQCQLLHRTACGAAGGAAFTWLVKRFFSFHPLLIFTLAASAYVTALAIFQMLVPRLGIFPQKAGDLTIG